LPYRREGKRKEENRSANLKGRAKLELESGVLTEVGGVGVSELLLTGRRSRSGLGGSGCWGSGGSRGRSDDGGSNLMERESDVEISWIGFVAIEIRMRERTVTEAAAAGSSESQDSSSVLAFCAAVGMHSAGLALKSSPASIGWQHCIETDVSHAERAVEGGRKERREGRPDHVEELGSVLAVATDLDVSLVVDVVWIYSRAQARREETTSAD
jgi:hypothetical protein